MIFEIKPSTSNFKYLFNTNFLLEERIEKNRIRNKYQFYYLINKTLFTLISFDYQYFKLTQLGKYLLQIDLDY